MMFYLFLLAHLVADFILQPLWLVRRKRSWDGLCIHIGLVFLCMLLLPLIEPASQQLIPAMLLISAVHFGVDYWKIHHADSLFNPPVVPFILDQLIHVVTLIVVLSMYVPAAQLWGLHSPPFAESALYLSGYILVACALPIALIVCFDPAFHYAPLAFAARGRSLLTAAVSLTLILLAGSVAIPIILIGAALMARHPFSRHPLDTPSSLLIILGCTSALGILLSAL